MKIGINDVLKQVRPFFIPYLILMAACIIIKLLFTKQQIYFGVNGAYSDFADLVMPYITDLGNGWTIVVLSALLVLFNYRTAFLMATTYALTSLSVQIIKYIADADRPTLLYRDKLSLIHVVKDVYLLKYYSFPSGHTVTAFSTALLVTYLAKNKNWGWLLFIVAVAVGYSRMYLSEHFFEDVTVGSALGIVLTIWWISYIDSKQFINSPKWNRGLLKKS
jgi:membrane-associated phospholipid phosphatase